MGYGEQLLTNDAEDSAVTGERMRNASDQVPLGAAVQVSVTCCVPGVLKTNVAVALGMPVLGSQRYVIVMG